MPLIIKFFPSDGSNPGRAGGQMNTPSNADEGGQKSGISETTISLTLRHQRRDSLAAAEIGLRVDVLDMPPPEADRTGLLVTLFGLRAWLDGVFGVLLTLFLVFKAFGGVTGPFLRGAGSSMTFA